MKREIPLHERPRGTRGMSQAKVFLGVCGLPLLVGSVLAFGGKVPSAELGLAVAGGLMTLLAGFFRLMWKDTLFSQHTALPWASVPRRITPLAAVAPGQRVAVTGRVVRHDGAVGSPLTNSQGFLVRIEISGYRELRGNVASWTLVHLDAQSVPVWISDGSGPDLYLDTMVAVDVERDSCTKQYGSSDGVDSFSSPIRRYIDTKALRKRLKLMDLIRVHETVGQEGDWVTVVGQFAFKTDGLYRDGKNSLKLCCESVEHAFLGNLDDLRTDVMRPVYRRRMLNVLCVAGVVSFLAGAVLVSQAGVGHPRRHGHHSKTTRHVVCTMANPPSFPATDDT